MALTIHGPALSTYVRSVRLLLEEKGAPYQLAQLDILKGEQQAPAHLARNPFGKVPAITEGDGFTLYETDAILRYLDRVVPGRSFTPAEPRRAARMDQLMNIVDAHGYEPIVQKLVIQRLVQPMVGGVADEAVIQAALPAVAKALAAIEALTSGDAHLVGQEASLADLMLAPIFGYLTKTPEAAALLAPHEGLRRWWAMIDATPSMRRTDPMGG